MMLVQARGDAVERQHPPALDSIVAREGSELAQALRARGWVARVGWRSVDGDGASVWNLRFEPPRDADKDKHAHDVAVTALSACDTRTAGTHRRR